MAKKSNYRRKQNRLLRTVIIVHGQSEKEICEAVKRTLRLPIEIISRDNGRHSIQVNGLFDLISSDRRFRTQKQFVEAFNPETEIAGRKTVLKPSVRVFSIMDLDDCDEKTASQNKSGELIKDHRIRDYFIPIWDFPNLEETMVKAKVPFKNKSIARKKVNTKSRTKLWQ